MKIKFLLVAFAVFAVSGITQAGLWSTPISNGSFENITPAAGDGPDWGYEIDDWFEDEIQDNGGTARTFWENGAAIGLAGDADRWGGTETGGAFYQAIGTVDDGATYTVSSLIGARWGNSFKTGSFNLYAGGVEADGADAVKIDTFATLLSSANVTVADGIQIADNVYAVSVDLTTGTGHAGELMWLEVRSVEGKDYFDAVSIVPEPATLALLGLGGFLLRKRR